MRIDVTKKLFTVDDFYRMADAGIFILPRKSTKRRLSCTGAIRSHPLHFLTSPSKWKTF